PVSSLDLPRRRTPRKLQHFSQHIEIDVINSDDQRWSTLEISCPDKPGILAAIGKVLAQKQIQLINARIATLGERVEDLFFIVDADNRRITDPHEISRLESDLKAELSA